MASHHIPPDFRRVIQHALAAYPALAIADGSRHARIVHREGDFVPVPGSPGDHRALAGFRAQLRRLGERGTGLVAARRH